MKHRLLATATAAALSLALPDAGAQTRLTLYSGDYDAVVQSEAAPGGPGFALVERTLGFDLAAGGNGERLGGLPVALDASSVVLRPLGAAQVRGQRFDFALAGQEDLLRRAIGQQVTVEQAVGDTRQSHTGVLVAAGQGLTLRLPDGRIKVLADYAGFELPRLPEGMVNEPTLGWDIAADRAGRQDFALSYATAGLAWRAEYQATVSGQGTSCRMDIEGAAMVANRSGADFADVALTLVAGEPNRVPGGGPMPMRAKSGRAEAVMMDAGTPAPEASGEYQAYRLPGTANLPQGSVQRLPLVEPARGVACERRYETGGEGGAWTPPYPILEANYGAVEGAQEQPVRATLRFANKRGDGLGVPLPAGRLRLFEGREFLGEASLGHTAINRDVRVEAGIAFDLSAARTRESFDLDRAGRRMEERIRIVVRNAKAGAASVRVIERLPRWSDWEIVDSTLAHARQDSQTIAFNVAVPAGGEAELSYTVRYRWAPDIAIP